MFVSIFIKFFFLLTPFFVLSVFMSMTGELESRERRRLALRVTRAVLVVSIALYFFGQTIFDVFGITLDAFRVGAGCLLFLSAVSLVGSERKMPTAEGEDISVVPLAIPITVGPATTGAILVLGAGEQALSERVVGCLALVAAVLAVGAMLYLAAPIQRALGRIGLSILTKLTGLVLAALSAQIVFTGARNLLAG
jgi:multiple antibiotic resistance protein